MATLDEAIKGVVDAVDTLESVKAEASAPPVDPVRAAVEDVLKSEGWAPSGLPAEEAA